MPQTCLALTTCIWAGKDDISGGQQACLAARTAAPSSCTLVTTLLLLLRCPSSPPVAPACICKYYLCKYGRVSTPDSRKELKISSVSDWADCFAQLPGWPGSSLWTMRVWETSPTTAMICPVTTIASRCPASNNLEEFEEMILPNEHVSGGGERVRQGAKLLRTEPGHYR